jgi:galactoside O-acetyltransferase
MKIKKFFEWSFISCLSGMPDPLGILLRRFFYKPLFAKFGSPVNIKKNVYINNPENIKIGNGVLIHEDCYLDGSSKRGVYIDIGDYCSINPGTKIFGGGGVTIGREVSIAAGVTIYSHQHNYKRKDLSIRQQGMQYAPVVIAEGVWICTRVVILPGVTIGKGAVIGAGAVVTKNVAPYSVVVGIPAKPIKKRV